LIVRDLAESALPGKKGSTCRSRGSAALQVGFAKIDREDEKKPYNPGGKEE
jgi:hypothetical protein